MTINAEYDFVIIGGGTAGLVLANRLTEDSSVSVAVLEAGNNRVNDPLISTPGMSVAMIDHDEYDWRFTSVPQKHLGGKIIAYPRGRTVGGSSAINILGLVYPNKSSIDMWGKLGNRGWGWEELFPYYQKYHTYDPPTGTALDVDYVDESLQGRRGPIHSSYPPFVSPIVEAWPSTFRSLGWGITADPLTGSSIGGFNGPYTVNPNGMVRSYAGNEYYQSVAHRPNLHLETSALVEKVLFEQQEDTLQAATVLFSSDGEKKSVRARKEIILAAGAFQSPQLLELSGIGSRELLEKLKIEVLLENENVGENLQDHAMTGICMEVKEGITTGDSRRDPAFAAKAKEMYEQHRTGPLVAGFPSFAYMPLPGWAEDTHLDEALRVHLDSFPANDSRPSRNDQAQLINDIIKSPSEASIQLFLGTSQVHFDKSSYAEVFAVTQPENYLTIMVALPHPLSAGTCHISSSNPQQLPVVDPRFMSHPLDPEVVARHMMALEKLLSAEPLAGFVKDNGRRLPAQSPFFAAKTSSERLEAGKEHSHRFIRSTSHPCGTCAMLPREKGGVVDERLRVYGTKGLRIVDASVFPMIPRGNIQSTVYAVAERAADFVKQEWGLGG